MSLELAIQENTDTMKQLIAVWNQLTAQAQTIKPENGITAGGVVLQPAQAEKVEAPKPAPTPAATATVAAAAPEVAAASPSEPLAYATVSKAITDMVKLNRDKAVAVLAQFGAKKGPDLKAEQYADFMAALAA